MDTVSKTKGILTEKAASDLHSVLKEASTWIKVYIYIYIHTTYPYII